MWNYAAWWTGTDILHKHTVSIFRVIKMSQAGKNGPCVCWDPCPWKHSFPKGVKRKKHKRKGGVARGKSFYWLGLLLLPWWWRQRAPPKQCTSLPHCMMLHSDCNLNISPSWKEPQISFKETLALVVFPQNMLLRHYMVNVINSTLFLYFTKEANKN
jgi:hypothetical protein